MRTRRGTCFSAGVLAAALLACAPGRSAAPAASPARPGDPDAAMLALAERYVERLFTAFPELAWQAGWPRVDHGAVADNRPEAVAAWYQDLERLQREARALPVPALGSAAWLARGVLLAELESALALRACRPELWTVNSPGGWHTLAALRASSQPVGTPELRTAAATQLSRLAVYVDREIANLREGLRTGFVATRANVERVTGELDALLALPPARWPLLDPADRDPAPGFRYTLERIVAEEVVPATRRYRSFLAGEYLAGARELPGVAGLPDGEACYRGAILSGTTLKLGPEALHALGRSRLEAIRAEMAEIARRSFGTDDVDALRRRFQHDPEFKYRDADDLVARARAALRRAEEAAPRAFRVLPRGRADVKPLPDFQARGGGTPRFTGLRNGDRLDGVFWLNAWDAAKRSRLTIEPLTFHESWPGHHLQSAIAAEGAAKPEIARYVVNNAYNEGWALYAERLAGELGLYSSDLDRFGVLASEALRAARLVVDTGIHAMGWTRERAVAFMLEHAPQMNPVFAASEVDRYSAWPGQALGYMVGALEIRRLRDDAARRLGERFDLRDFHEVVLSDGSVTLPMLDEKVQRWVASR